MLKTQTIKIAHSPDSDDAFMFYAIKHKKIDLKGYEFEFSSDEIEALNQAAINTLSGIESPYDIFAVSFHAYHYLQDKYAFLKAGASMAGKDYGPRLVTKADSESFIARSEATKQSQIKIAVPGKYTSAFLVLQNWLKEQTLTTKSLSEKLPDARLASPRKRSLLNVNEHFEDERNDADGTFRTGSKPEFIFCSYNEVFPLLESNQVEASLLIHESQLKFQEQGYQLIVDLGKWWHDTKGLRMPLGTNVVRRDLGAKFIADFDSLLKESIEWGLNNFDEVLAYSRKFANNELDDAQAQRYINMYVDESTVQLTENDLKSVELLLSGIV